MAANTKYEKYGKMISVPFLPTANPWAEPAMNQAHDRRTQRKHFFWGATDRYERLENTSPGKR